MTTETTARTFAGYYRELRASGIPRGLAETLVTTAAANDRIPRVHPDASAAVDSTRDKALGVRERAETMARHPAGKGRPQVYLQKGSGSASGQVVADAVRRARESGLL